jgi:hypothetical protein
MLIEGVLLLYYIFKNYFSTDLNLTYVLRLTPRFTSCFRDYIELQWLCCASSSTELDLASCSILFKFTFSFDG